MTVGGFVLETHANVSDITHQLTAEGSQLAYHKLYNRPASPLSCLWSSSCSSPLLNKNKSDVVDSLQWGIKRRWHWVLFIRGLARRPLLLADRPTPLIPTIVRGASLAGLLQTNPPPLVIPNFLPTPLFLVLSVSVRELGVLRTCKFYKPMFV